MPPFCFDTLPIHPQPESLETLSSYLTRLAEANGISTLGKLRSMIFPHRNSTILKTMMDLPLVMFDLLPDAAACPQPILQATTIYHIARKFARRMMPSAVFLFFRDSIAQCLRYCPKCFQVDRPYHILPWRFNYLKGCALHGCYLLDRCSQCGNEIPLMAAPLKIATCPKCNRFLGEGNIELMDEVVYDQVRLDYQDLVFLLSPQPIDTEPVPLGPRLAYWRHIRQISPELVGQQIGRPADTILALEKSVPEEGNRFSNYVAYINCLKVSFITLFNTVPTPEAEKIHREALLYSKRQKREEELLERVQRAITTLKAQGQPLNPDAVASLAGVTRSVLTDYPRTRSLWSWMSQEYQQYKKQKMAEREQKILTQLEQAIRELHAAGKPVNQVTIYRHIGIPVVSTKNGKRYPRLKVLHDRVSEEYRRSRPQRKEQAAQAMLTKVQDAIIQLKSQGQPVGKYLVARMIGIPATTLSRYIDFSAVLAQSEK